MQVLVYQEMNTGRLIYSFKDLFLNQEQLRDGTETER